MIAMRWTFRSIGMLSTIILARLLTPSDFGIVAMAMIVVGILQVLSYFNVDLVLMQIKKPGRTHYDTAWTFQVLGGLVLSALIAIAAPIGAAYLREPRIVPVIRVLALAVLIDGFINIGLVDFRRELNFHKEFWFTIISKALTFSITVGFAFYLRSYWALVIGSVGGQAIKVVLSYWLHAYRPRFSLSESSHFISFSKWMVIFHIGNFLVNRFDSIVVGRLAGSAEMGTYHISSEISTMMPNEVVLPLGRALFPGYAKLSEEENVLSGFFLTVLAVLSAVISPIAVGVSVSARDIVPVILGNKWGDAVPLMQVLALVGIPTALIHAIGTFLVARSKTRINASIRWVQFGLLVACLPAAGAVWGVLGIATARTLVAYTILPLSIHFVTRTGLVSVVDLAKAFWRGWLASGLMAIAVMLSWSVEFGPIATLLVDICVGGSMYLLFTYVLWRTSGRPPGPETIFIEFVSKGSRRLREAATRVGR